MRRLVPWGLGLLVLAGCAQDQGATLSCPGPDATGCEPLSQVYAREIAAAPIVQPPAAAAASASGEAPRLEPARIVRVWLAPWEDGNGDLHDHQYLYLVLRAPRWQLGDAPVGQGLAPAPPESE